MKHHLSLCSYSLPLLSLAAHTQAPSERKPVVRQPGIDSAHENSAKPPLVKLIRGSATGSWAKHWSLALLFTALGLQWTLFWICRLPGCPSNSIHARRHLYHIRINYSITTPVLIICGWMETCRKWRMMEMKNEAEEELRQEVEHRPAASLPRVYAHVNPTHIQLPDQARCFL